MAKVELSIKHAINLPQLGVVVEPSPYIIVQCEGKSTATGICKYTKNPQWMTNLTIDSKQTSSNVHFYIYNNNPNHIDQLLAYGNLQFQQLMTRVTTSSKIKLRSSVGHFLVNSYLFIQHYDAKPRDIYLPITENTCLKFGLLSDLPAKTALNFEYGELHFNLQKPNLTENTFVYKAKEEEIIVKLKKGSKEMVNRILIGNLQQVSFYKLRFDDEFSQYTIFLSANVILNGQLPKGHNILKLQLDGITVNNNQKDHLYQVKAYSSFHQVLFNKKPTQSTLYVQNHSTILFAIFLEQVQNQRLEQVQPLYTTSMAINSLNWSQSNEAKQQLKMYDEFSGEQTIIFLKLKLCKNSELQRIIPSVVPSQCIIDDNSGILIQQLKLSNFYINEILKPGTKLEFIHIDIYGFVNSFAKFIVKQESTEYTIQTTTNLNNSAKGNLYLISTQPFIENQYTFNSLIIFQINLEKKEKIDSAPISYNKRFIAFAKKVSLVNVCKKFNQMVQDQTLKITAKTKTVGAMRKGLLKIINIKITGIFSPVEVLFIIDGNSVQVQGQTKNYLMKKPYFLHINKGNIAVHIMTNEGKKCFYSNFSEYFGTPQANNIYNFDLKISANLTLSMIYSFCPFQKQTVLPALKEENYFFKETESIQLQLYSANVSIVNKMYKFKLNRGKVQASSLEYIPSTNHLNFIDEGEIFQFIYDPKQYQKSNTENNSQEIQKLSSIIFINANSFDQENKLVIYNGMLDIKSLVGEGFYEVVLQSQFQKNIFLKLKLLNKKSTSIERDPLKINHPSNLPLSHPSNLTLTVNRIECKSLLPNISKVISFRTIYKYYLFITKQNTKSIFEVSLLQNNTNILIVSNKNNNMMEILAKIGDSFMFQLYCSYKSIAKEQFQSNCQKELVARRKCYYQDFITTINSNAKQINSNTKQSSQCSLKMQYKASKQQQLKLNTNYLGLLEDQVQVMLQFNLISNETSANKQQQLVLEQFHRKKIQELDIDVLTDGFLIIKIKTLFTSMHSQSAKLLSLKVQPINLECNSQIKQLVQKTYYISANNMQFSLEAQVLMKQGQQISKYMKKQTVNLKGQFLKTNQCFYQHFSIKECCSFRYQGIVLSNKFTAAPKGKIIIQTISIRGFIFDTISVSFKEHYYQKILGNQQMFSIKGSQNNNINKEFQTNSILNCFCFIFVKKEVQFEQTINISEINIDKINEEAIFYQLILSTSNNQKFILEIQIKYFPFSKHLKEESAISYEIQQKNSNLKKINVKYNEKIIKQLITHKDQHQKEKPSRANGFQMIASLPANLQQKIEEIQIIGEKEKFIIKKSGLGIFKKYLPSEISVKTIALKDNKQFLNYEIQKLGMKQHLQKFILNQNEKLICRIFQTEYKISNLGADDNNWSVVINPHRCLTQKSVKKLLKLKNSPHDEILTKTLGILIKHGHQQQVLYNVLEDGSFQQPTHTHNQNIRFGYDVSSDQLQIYLFIQNYFNQNIADVSTLNLSNWMQFMPICYGVISLQKIQSQNFVGCTLSPIQNTSLNLEHSLNAIISCEQDIIFVGEVFFQPKCWGYISVTLKEVTPVIFNGKEEINHQIFVYYHISVQNSQRNLLAEKMTECRKIISTKNLYFTTNSFNFLFYDEKPDEHYHIKIIGFMIDGLTTVKFLQKRQQISQQLRKRNKTILNIQVKPNQIQNRIKNAFQISVEISNTVTPIPKLDLLQEAKQVNNIDVISFKEQSQEEILLKLLVCQHLSHFLECLEEIKESFIYKNETQFELMTFLLSYLSFDHHSGIVRIICQILQMNLLKNYSIVGKMEENAAIFMVYSSGKKICKGEDQRIPQNTNRVTSQIYQAAIASFKAKKSLSQFENVVLVQKQIIFKPEQLLRCPSSINCDIILNILILFVKHSKALREKIHVEIEQWIQIFGFKEDKEFQLFMLFLQTNITFGLNLHQNVLAKLVEILINRTYNLPVLYQFWANISHQQTKISNLIQCLIKYQENIKNNINLIHTLKGFKLLFIKYFSEKQIEDQKQKQKFKNQFNDKNILQQSENITEILLIKLSKQNEILSLNASLDLLICFSTFKILNQQKKNMIMNILKAKMIESKENSTKIVIQNYMNKLSKKQQHISNKNVEFNKDQSGKEKKGLIKKYLITND